MTIPTLPEPVVPELPAAPRLELPPVLTLTREDAEIYRDLCEETGEADYCEWAIRGFTIQDWLTVETLFINMAGYAEECRSVYDTVLRIMHSRQDAMDQQWERLSTDK